jgi:6-phosphofructokinase 1
LGGDGTHKGIRELYLEIKRRGLKIAVAGIPKTIDNDIPIIDKSFGFETSVEEAEKAIKSAWVEAHCAEYGVGLVRLMGRHAGFIAMEACNASRIAHVCLVPEFKFNLFGEFGVLEYIYKRLLKKKNCVVVVAEGAGEAVQDLKIHKEGSIERDASGNVKLDVIRLFVKTRISAHFCKKKLSTTVKIKAWKSL